MLILMDFLFNSQTEQHFTDVVLSEEFLNLGIEQVCSLISSDKLTISSEEKVRIFFFSQCTMMFPFFLFIFLIAHFCVALWSCMCSDSQWCFIWKLRNSANYFRKRFQEKKKETQDLLIVYVNYSVSSLCGRFRKFLAITILYLTSTARACTH